MIGTDRTVGKLEPPPNDGAPVGKVTVPGLQMGVASGHDAVHQTRLLREALQSEKRQVGFLLGAGCPLGIYDTEGTKSIKHIPDVAGLTAAVSLGLGKGNRHAELWAKLSAACMSETVPTPNVEHILTQIRTLCALKGMPQVDGMARDDLEKLDVKICSEIAKIVGKALPSHRTSYHRFAAWIGQIERDVPVEVFTPNYDLLLEQAFEEYAVPFFDGFVGAREPFFDVTAMEQDALPPRWTRLWKLHGSINWVRRENETVYRCHPTAEGQRLCIYPSHLKYEQSRRMPYLAMADRLRAFFRTANPVLVVCGYSFADDHLNEVLLDGLRGNRSAHCFAVLYPKLEECSVPVQHARKHANLTVLAQDGAVIGTRAATYVPAAQAALTPGGGIAIAAPDGKASDGSEGPAVCLLGDFHHLTLFMEAQFGVTVNNTGSGQTG